jgi:ATP-dependent helicase HrpB
VLPAEVADLPIAPLLPQLLAALSTRHEAVVVAPPGAGKTTTVPLALLDASWRGDGRIVMLEPRRLATRAAAQRMASLLGETVGDTVGYQTRDERRIGRSTRIEVVTEGVLTRRLQHDPALDGVAAVLFDEVHERNLPTDVGLALLLDAREAVRPDLRVVLMSATPDIAALHRALPDAPVLRAEGRTFPVELHWVPAGRDERRNSDPTPRVVATVLRALREQDGDVLVFLPGIGEIRRAESALRGQVADHVDVLPLAGALTLAEHDAALSPSPAGRRRVVLSTDIAESSLTVAGVRVVVDAGLARVPRFDARTGMTRLTTVSTSRASADQRAGRAGRTEPGACYRLWSTLEHSTRRAHLEAEITQVDLAGTALELAVWGTPAERLTWIDPPPAKTMRQAHDLLRTLSAIDADGRATALGRRMADVPAHPRVARMVIDAVDRGEGSLACVIAALLDERDILRGRPDSLPADLALRVGVVTGQWGHDAADGRDVRRVRDRAADVARRVGVSLDLQAVRPDHAGAVLGVGFPDRLAIARSQPGQFQLRGGQGAFVAADDPMAGERFVFAAELDGQRSGARIRLAAAVDAGDVIRIFADEIEHRATLQFDRGRGDLVMRDELRLGSLVLDERVSTPLPGDEVVQALVQHVRAGKLATLPMADADSLRRRVEVAGRLQPDRWPDWSDRALLATLDQWLAPFLGRATGVRDLATLDIEMMLRTQLSWDQQQQLDHLLPSHFTTPSGRRLPIDYGRATPTVSVRVQQVFGVREHPTVGNGALPLTMELLSPADRPIQITGDLPGFWDGSWAEVRKEMAGRYPKHAWPVDPRIA